MSISESPPRKEDVVMDADTMAAVIEKMAKEIVKGNPDMESVVLLGILRRGRPLAERLATHINDTTGVLPPVGSLGTVLYRDDLRSGMSHVKPGIRATHFDFSIDDVTVILVDDVIAAGRTTRAALDEVMDYGRPRRIQLAGLLDRGGRELPIQPDYLGLPVDASADQYVSVRLKELDDRDIVFLRERTKNIAGKEEE